MRILEIKHLENFIEANPLTSIKSNFPILNKSLSQKKAEAYKELLSYLTFSDYTHAAVVELSEILEFNTSLEQTKVKQWTQKYLNFFNENLLLFGIDYLDTENKENKNIYLSRIGEYVDKEPFQPIIKFWECMWLLYFGQYHLDKEQRSPPDPIGSYYYAEPDLNEPSDFEKLLIYLQPD